MNVVDDGVRNEEREERDTGPRGACELSDWKGRGGCVRGKGWGSMV